MLWRTIFGQCQQLKTPHSVCENAKLYSHVSPSNGDDDALPKADIDPDGPTFIDMTQFLIDPDRGDPDAHDDDGGCLNCSLEPTIPEHAAMYPCIGPCNKLKKAIDAADLQHQKKRTHDSKESKLSLQDKRQPLNGSTVMDSGRYPAVPAHQNVNANRSELYDGALLSDPFKEDVIDDEDRQFLGLTASLDDTGPRLRIHLGSKVKIAVPKNLASQVNIWEESFTLGQVLQNANPGALWKPNDELTARRFRLDDVFDVECDMVYVTGDGRPELVTTQLSHCLREVNVREVKYLEDGLVDWAEVRLILHKRQHLLRKATEGKVPVAEAESPRLHRNYSKDSIGYTGSSNAVAVVEHSELQNFTQGQEHRGKTESKERDDCTVVKCEWL
eukprot:gnl/MRDRNA2_/MRDRNA2_35292_c0_seq1.p1 gnl/MRDRNA2_/MRDRNA2_35292_c0~~gnl/MRDRNA2_/MRDRNA2_35292_c0_seq1.p1  ORF type:complete len:387 (-),score=84.69 gnl/MRDRNA2_/MRDRNA2_35292_c0_seq1:48-1208(-)